MEEKSIVLASFIISALLTILSFCVKKIKIPKIIKIKKRRNIFLIRFFLILITLLLLAYYFKEEIFLMYIEYLFQNEVVNKVKEKVYKNLEPINKYLAPIYSLANGTNFVNTPTNFVKYSFGYC